MKGKQKRELGFINKRQCGGSVEEARRGQNTWPARGDMWAPHLGVADIMVAVDLHLYLFAAEKTEMQGCAQHGELK